MLQVKDCLELSDVGAIKVLDRPGNNSGLNLIENLCCIVKNKVAEKQPSSDKHLLKQ